MRIRTFAASDLDAVADFHRIYAEVGAADNPESFVESPVEEIRQVLSSPSARFSFTAFLGTLDGEPVASGWCATDLKDDRRLAHLTPRVLPRHRRNGYGTRMLEVMERHAADLGRTLFQASAVWGAEHGPDGASSAPVQFASSNGWQLGLANTRLRLTLPADRKLAESLLAQRADRRSGYRTRSWSGPVPEELLADWAVLHAALSEDAPRGLLAQQTEAVDSAAIRDDERILSSSGKVKFNAVAISAEGDLVAFSSIVVRTDTATPAFQQGTIVRREHRGHGIGALVKVAALRLLEHHRPDIPAVITENAQDNQHMLGLNRALGFVPVLHSGDFQKELGARSGQDEPIPSATSQRRQAFEAEAA
jgi:GNAT superfamily N-acetyltransferase